jgi:cell division protein ZapE
MHAPVRARYEDLVRSGALDADSRQRELAEALDRLLASLSGEPRKVGLKALGRVLGGSNGPPRGLYIFGGVGVGKTLLMDIFFEVAPGPLKRRIHFHAFMAEAQERIAAFRQELRIGERRGGDPIPSVAAAIAEKAGLLCLDELSVEDIADAMIVGRLFKQLFARGVVVVATSNVPPNELYKGGLNRGLFLPFLALLKERMAPFHLDGARDYRLGSSDLRPLYVTPLGPAATAALDEHFRRLSGGDGEPCSLAARGRRIVVPRAAGGVARFSFDDLCGRPLAAADYLKIAAAFHTVLVDDVPVLDASRRNEAKRLILLIDTLYDKRVRLIVSAAAEPDRLWLGSDRVESREFARTASRLFEMRSGAYWREAGLSAAEKKTARAVQPGRRGNTG